MYSGGEVGWGGGVGQTRPPCPSEGKGVASLGPSAFSEMMIECPFNAPV